MKYKGGFTLVELLTVIAVIALLMSITMPALQAARVHAKKVQCSSNIRAVVDGLIMYAGKNDSKLPYAYQAPNTTPPALNLPWEIGRSNLTPLVDDIGVSTRNICETPAQWQQRGKDIEAPKAFYCPANDWFNEDSQPYWDFWDSSGFTPYRALGYFFMLDWRSRNRNSVQPIFIKRNSLGQKEEAEKFWLSKIEESQPAQKELVVDITVSDEYVDASEYPMGNFEYLEAAHFRDGMTKWPKAVFPGTSHRKGGKQGAGGNVGFLDGHVDWRLFRDMDRRVREDGGPTLWW